MTDRFVTQSPVTQGPDEEIAYDFNWSAIGTPDDEGDFVLYDSSLADVSSTNLSGAASITGDVITSPKVVDLASLDVYYLLNTVTVDGNTLSAVLKIATDLI